MSYDADAAYSQRCLLTVPGAVEALHCIAQNFVLNAQRYCAVTVAVKVCFVSSQDHVQGLAGGSLQELTRLKAALQNLSPRHSCQWFSPVS